MKAAYFALALLLVGAGCAPSPTSTSPHINFTEEPLSTGSDTLTFDLYGNEGQLLTLGNLHTVHEKLVHLIVVSDDLADFYHLHPSFTHGTWSVDTAITTPGTYRVYADAAPTEGDALVIKSTLNVSGDVIEEAATEETIQAKLATVTPLTAGISTELLFRLTKDDEAVAQIDPYLGAYGHVVGLRQDDASVYLDIHPVTETTPEDGIVKFATTFPSAGEYHLFAQFNVDGEIRTFPFMVDVIADATNVPAEGNHHMMHH